MDMAEWYNDYSEIGPDEKRKKDFFDLAAKLGTDLAKAGLIAALTTASVSLLFGAAAVLGVTIAAPVILVVAGTIAVSVLWTFLVEKGDKAVGRSLGKSDTTTWLANKFRETAEHLSKVSKDTRYAHYELTQILPIGR
jgi:fatty acid desaturase